MRDLKKVWPSGMLVLILSLTPSMGSLLVASEKDP